MPRRHLSAPPPGRLEAVLAPRRTVPEAAATGWVPDGADLTIGRDVPSPARSLWPALPAPPSRQDRLEVPARPEAPDSPGVLDRLDVPAASEALTRLDQPAGQLEPGPDVVGRHRRPAPPPPRLLTLPDPLRGAVTRPRRLAVLGLLVTLVGATVLFGVRVAWARQASAPHPVVPRAGPSGLVGRSVPSAFASGPSAAGASATAGVVVVDVVGQVRRPGVVRLPAGSRVLDAVTRAGGALPGADLAQVNLARVLVDGEQLLVPKPGQLVSVAPGPGTTGAGVPSGVGGGAGGVVDLNTADATALDSLPGVGPVLAQRILDWRTEHGRFSSVDELGEVSGIGDKLMSQLRPKVRV
ncbi:MAG TPA: helix-hairpin-helix domain-containing protein [Oryzihumus sp.]|nr:helix-hairpin-helix domain-containing protein [Oryzihumus sp.]